MVIMRSSVKNVLFLLSLCSLLRFLGDASQNLSSYIIRTIIRRRILFIDVGILFYPKCSVRIIRSLKLNNQMYIKFTSSPHSLSRNADSVPVCLTQLVKHQQQQSLNYYNSHARFQMETPSNSLPYLHSRKLQGKQPHSLIHRKSFLNSLHIVY